MATFTIKLEKEDIKTNILGKNFLIQAQGVNIVFSRESLEELITDWEEAKIILDKLEQNNP
jgi:hypothetical protein